MNDPTPDLIKLAETEFARAELKARYACGRLSVILAALFIAALAVMMLTISGYFALAEHFSTPIAALITAGVLAAIAVSGILFANRRADRAHVLELQMAALEVEKARLRVRQNMQEIEKSVGEIERQVSSLTHGLTGLLGGTSSGGSGLAASFPIVLIGLRLLSSVSPTLRKYIQPILNAAES